MVLAHNGWCASLSRRCELSNKEGSIPFKTAKQSRGRIALKRLRKMHLVSFKFLKWGVRGVWSSLLGCQPGEHGFKSRTSHKAIERKDCTKYLSVTQEI